MINSVNLVGRLTDKPNVITNTANGAVVKFSVALTEKTKDGEKTYYPNIVCFSHTADFAIKYLDKGTKVAISGKLTTGSYEKSDGSKVYTTEVVANNIEALSAKQDMDDTKTALRNAKEPQPPYNLPEVEDGDLPF